MSNLVCIIYSSIYNIVTSILIIYYLINKFNSYIFTTYIAYKYIHINYHILLYLGTLFILL